MTIGRTGIGKHVEELTNKGKWAVTELYRFNSLPANIKVHPIKAYILPIIQYPTIPLTAVSNNNKQKLQKIQNKALRYAFNEKYPYAKNTKTLHELAGTELINYNLYNRAKDIFTRMESMQDNQFMRLINNYERIRDHLLFKKSKNIIDRRPPEKKISYEIRDHQ